MATAGKHRREDVLVLCYHAVSEAWQAELSVTTSALRQQLELLVERGYRGATFHDAVTSPPSRRTLVVTFDDAFSSVDLAYPILTSMALPATVFVATAFADSNEPLQWPGIDVWNDSAHAGELRGLSWQRLRQLADRGWEIGSHTRTHPRLTQLTDAELVTELRESRDACERALGRPCRSLAYPYGDFDSRVATAAAEAGYAAAATLRAGLPRPAAMAWPRIGVYRKDSLRRFRMKVSPTTRLVRTALAPVEGLVRA